MEKEMRILILGAKGMAGHIIKMYLEKNTNHTVFGIARNVEEKDNLINLDVENLEGVEKVIANQKIDYVVNCIGLLNQTAENNPEMAIWFNGYFPHYLAKLSKSQNFKLIHISTDCVFSGKTGDYSEDSIKDGLGFYAQSKAIGEINDDKNLTLRTSIIGPELNKNGIGLFHWYMFQGNDLKGYTQAFWSGVTSLELAKAIKASIEQNITGLYHLVNNEKINKFDLLQLFNKTYHSDSKTITPFSDYQIDKSLINNRSDFNYTVPSYEIMIDEMKTWMNKNPKDYKQYLN